jgi:WhiB family redox-sensing transcriptional regulator
LKEVIAMRSQERTVRANASHPPRPGTAAPHRDVQEWRIFAACGGAAALFYKTDLESAEQTPHRVTKAKSVCKTCPVRPQCAAHALAVAEPYGIWGGFTEGERALLRATDWRRYADRRCTVVDVAKLEDRVRAVRAQERAVLPDVA